MKLYTGLILFLLIALFTGCSTPYQAMGLNGGYKDSQVTQDTFAVDFIAHSVTPKETVSKYALRRAAEVCLEHGYSHFMILNMQDTYSGVHESRVMIKCFKTASNDQCLSAEEYLKHNSIKT